MTEITEDDIRVLRQQNDLKTFMHDGMRAAHDMNNRRRALVLRHPDLAQHLCDPPLKCPAPEAWTGYLPPELWNGRTNDSPIRTQLLAIVQAADSRARARAAPAA